MFKFSTKNYYIFVSFFLLYPLVWAIWRHSWLPLLFFAVFSVAGVVAEVLMSFWWKCFFERQLWSYRVETEIHNYTSRLNFIPWGTGGLLYLNLLQFTRLPVNKFNHPFFLTFGEYFFIGLIIQFLISTSVKRKANKITFGNYLFFCMPFMLALGVSVVSYGSDFLLIALIFALIPALLEYLFGKIMEIVISKKFWVYNYMAFDGGHFTPLSLMLFSLAGFYFWAIAAFIFFLS